VGEKSLSSLMWVSRFLDETVGDEEVGGKPRQVLGACWSRVHPTPVPKPTIRLWSKEMAEELNLQSGDPECLGGNKVVSGMDPFAQRYGGHQFGNWAGQLGDGRAISLGEVKTESGFLELQLKGSGITPYSRFADGKAVLRSSIREFLCSEAIHHLRIPTTRALSLVTTGEEVIRDIMYDGRPEPEPGAIVCRVAPSFIRFGSFQIHTLSGDYQTLRNLIDFTVKHHFPNHSINDDDSIIEWLKQIADETSLMVAHWMRVGFVHGVMNTDNMSIHGLTIDYGPYGWIENYDLGWTPNTTDLRTKRYRFGNQPQIGAWNYARFLESISPLMDDKDRLYEALDHYTESFEKYNNEMWAEKLGFDEYRDNDSQLIEELQENLQICETDMTIFFRLLSMAKVPEINELEFAFYDIDNIPIEKWNNWLKKWWLRVDENPNRELMKKANPKYVLRNWMAQLAIDAAENDDFSIAEELYELLKNPYDECIESEEKWFQKRPDWAKNKVGCSMLSCSS